MSQLCTNPLKILHVIANLAPRYGGPSKACRDMARAIARRGHAVSIFTTNMDGPGELDVPTDRPVVEDDVAVSYYPIGVPRFWGTSWPLAAGLKRAISGFDVVHLHSLYLFHDWATGHYCQAAGVPYILRPHGTLDPYIYHRHRLRKAVMDTLFQNRVLRGAAAIHYTTEEEMRLAEPYACGAPGAVVPHGLDIADYEGLPPPGSFRARHSEIGDKTIVLFFGRLNFKKGLDILARAFGSVASARNDVHLVLAGPDDGMLAKTRGCLREAGVLDRATFTGMLLGEEKLALLGDADLFVLPSHSENFGIAVVEAMACGLPVAISDKVNIWREVEGAGAGAVSPPEAEAFAAAIAGLLDDPARRRVMGEAGQGLVANAFDWSRVAERLETLYTAVAGGDRPNQGAPHRALS